MPRETQLTELPRDEQALLSQVPADGRARANGPIQRELDWTAGRYERVKASLIEHGLIERARGRGGAVKRCQQIARPEPVGRVPVPTGWTQDQVALYRHVPEDGAAIGNKRLRTILDWEEDRYWEARDALLEREELGRGRGKGGSVYRLFEVDPEDGEPDDVEAEDAVDAEGWAHEVDLYPPFEEYLRYRARDELGLGDQYFVQITAHQGRRQTGGRWSRPDLIIASRPRFKHVPDRRLEVQSFEIKLPAGAIAGVYETVAHSRNVHRSYLAVCTSDDTEWTDTADFSRVKAECERLGVGLIIFDDPEDVDSYETTVDARFQEPEPSDLDGFLDTQISDENRERLRGWFT